MGEGEMAWGRWRGEGHHVVVSRVTVPLEETKYVWSGFDWVGLLQIMYKFTYRLQVS